MTTLETNLECINRQTFQRFLKHGAILFPSGNETDRVLDVIQWWKEVSGYVLRVLEVELEKKSRGQS
jgi:hypothetical protein